MDRTEALRRQLSSASAKDRSDALSAAVKLGELELSPDIRHAFQKEEDGFVKGRCAWALGRLRYRVALPQLRGGLDQGDPEVRSWCAWALGEVGYDGEEKLLIRALAREDVESVKRAIGGALKKLHLESVRVPRREVEKRLQPPPTSDYLARSLVDKLSELRWPGDSAAIVALRRQLQERDPLYFRAYMQWVKEKPGVERALEDPRKVYDSR